MAISFHCCLQTLVLDEKNACSFWRQWQLRPLLLVRDALDAMKLWRTHCRYLCREIPVLLSQFCSQFQVLLDEIVKLPQGSQKLLLVGGNYARMLYLQALHAGLAKTVRPAASAWPQRGQCASLRRANSLTSQCKYCASEYTQWLMRHDVMSVSRSHAVHWPNFQFRPSSPQNSPYIFHQDLFRIRIRRNSFHTRGWSCSYWQERKETDLYRQTVLSEPPKQASPSRTFCLTSCWKQIHVSLDSANTHWTRTCAAVWRFCPNQVPETIFFPLPKWKKNIVSQRAAFF